MAKLAIGESGVVFRHSGEAVSRAIWFGVLA